MRDEFPDIASQLTIRMVEGATHGFDWSNPPTPAFSPFAKAQNGGVVTMRYAPQEAEIAQKEMVEYFKKNLN